MKTTSKTQLEIYLKQGKAMRELLIKTNVHGKHDRKIQGLTLKIAGAQRCLAKMK